jgi:hypothetical protein
LLDTIYQLEVQFLSKFNLDLEIEAIHQYLSGNGGIKNVERLEQE